jgi:hypothetical protein
MDMSKTEFVRYVGLILGTSGAYVLLGVFGFFGWPALIASFCVGLGLGWLFETQFKQLQLKDKR